MPTLTYAVTDTAADVVAGLSLADGQGYIVQNVGSELVLLSESAAADDAGIGWHILRRGEILEIEPASGGPIWLRTPTGRVSSVAVTEV